MGGFSYGTRASAMCSCPGADDGTRMRQKHQLQSAPQGIRKAPRMFLVQVEQYLTVLRNAIRLRFA